ncbi:MAG: hypothetical protein V4700_00140 [Pseudomonadota bacterium]
MPISKRFISDKKSPEQTSGSHFSYVFFPITASLNVLGTLLRFIVEHPAKALTIGLASQGAVLSVQGAPIKNAGVQAFQSGSSINGTTVWVDKYYYDRPPNYQDMSDEDYDHSAEYYYTNDGSGSLNYRYLDNGHYRSGRVQELFYLTAYMKQEYIDATLNKIKDLLKDFSDQTNQLMDKAIYATDISSTDVLKIERSLDNYIYSLATSSQCSERSEGPTENLMTSTAVKNDSTEGVTPVENDATIPVASAATSVPANTSTPVALATLFFPAIKDKEPTTMASEQVSQNRSFSAGK